jgi:hypothetical protein
MDPWKNSPHVLKNSRETKQLHSVSVHGFVSKSSVATFGFLVFFLFFIFYLLIRGFSHLCIGSAVVVLFKKQNKSIFGDIRSVSWLTILHRGPGGRVACRRTTWPSYSFRLSTLHHSLKNRTGEWTGEVTGSLVHWSNQWPSWFNSDKKPLKLINN